MIVSLLAFPSYFVVVVVAHVPDDICCQFGALSDRVFVGTSGWDSDFVTVQLVIDESWRIWCSQPDPTDSVVMAFSTSPNNTFKTPVNLILTQNNTTSVWRQTAAAALLWTLYKDPLIIINNNNDNNDNNENNNKVSHE